MKWHQWLFVIFSCWLIISPWLLGFSALDLALWNNVIIGVLVLILTLWNVVNREEQ